MGDNDRSKLMIIDGNSLIHRAFYALPSLTNREGLHTNAMYGFLTMLFSAFDQLNPDYVAVAFDLKGPTFRHESYDAYKAGRKKMPEELAQQIEPLKELLDALGLYRIQAEGFEADDLIGTMARLAESHGVKTTIISGDRDVLQLVSEQTSVMLTKKGMTQMAVYTPEILEKEYGVPVTAFVDLKGLAGDSSDNIPGVPGVGPKTALKLVQQFGNIENLLQRTEEISNQTLRDKMETYREQLVLSKKLSMIMTDIPIEFDLEKLRTNGMDQEKVRSLFQAYEFKSLLSRIPVDSCNKETHQKQNVFTWHEQMDNACLDQLENELKKQPILYLRTEATPHPDAYDRIAGIALAGADGTACWLDCRKAYDERYLSRIGQWVRNPAITKVVHDSKRECRIWINQTGRLDRGFSDVMIADYLLNPSKSDYQLESMAAEYTGIQLKSMKQYKTKERKEPQLANLTSDEMREYLQLRLHVIAQMYPQLEDEVRSREMDELYTEVELPLALVLARMEEDGIQIDRGMLNRFSVEYETKIDALTKEIYETAGASFNINSTRQLSEILFQRLKLTPVKKTKTGYSTDMEVLEKLKNEHEIIQQILQYRQLTKLKNTYIDGMQAIVQTDTGRIHSTFHQTAASTGRISSAEPNLQNIPVRTDMGRQLRRLFVSREGWRLIDADYSQIELRVLAHLSKDPGLQKAFSEDADIHTRTAAEIFNVQEEQVTSEMRTNAKAVNFGIIYGISDYGLSINLNISREQARKYIDEYLEKYTGVREYMNRMIQDARDKGYVTTLMNRIRYIPEIKAKQFVLRSFGERMAMNTPIQGSAADIIKKAMVRVARELEEDGYNARLILQVHDELIVEAPENEVEAVSRLVRMSMEEAADLSVPLKVDLSVADNWFDAK